MHDLLYFVDFDEGFSFEEELGMMDESGAFDLIEDIDVEDDAQVANDSQEHRWARTSTLSIAEEEKINYSGNNQDLSFQWLDLDMISGPPLATNPDGSGNVVGNRDAVTPIVRLFGVTAEGISVMACVHGFMPYIYVQLSPSLNLSDEFLGNLRMVSSKHDVFYTLFMQSNTFLALLTLAVGFGQKDFREGQRRGNKA